MARFELAWLLTSSWEGKWSAKPESGSQDEEYVRGQFWGTNYGITGAYVRDFVRNPFPFKAGSKLLTAKNFGQLSFNECGQIWAATRWTWLRGDDIENQEIANLLFDWGVRKWNSLTVTPIVDKKGNTVAHKSGILSVLNLKTETRFPSTAHLSAVLMTAVGGKPVRATDGFFQFTPELVRIINATASGPNNVALHEDLKTKRLTVDNPREASIINRYNSFQFEGTPTKPEWEAGTRIVPIEKRLDRAQNKRQLVADGTPNDDSSTLWTVAKWIGGIWLGVKILKRVFAK